MTTTVDPRIAILSDLSDPPYNEVTETRCVPWDDAVKLLNAYRAAVLREAADVAGRIATAYREGDYGEELTSREIRDAIETVADELHRMAAAPEPEATDG